MTLTQFANGYWYAAELKDFAASIGIQSASQLRKDELERAITVFLQTGKTESPAKRSLATSGVRDVDRGLRLDLRVVVYTNDKKTKTFLEREAAERNATMAQAIRAWARLKALDIPKDYRSWKGLHLPTRV